MKTIWVFENDARYLELANDAIDTVSKLYNIEIAVQTFRDIVWPPISNIEITKTSWPDIVVLDMMDSGDKLGGHNIYAAIRSENSKRQTDDPNYLPTFIVLWTAYPANGDIEEFTKLKYNDLCLITCDIKSKRALVENIGICIERLEEQYMPGQIAEI